MKRALVLSGGGAKGSYELGVYKALKRLGIKIDIITGTSIGALNGAVLCTGDYRKVKKLWLKMSSDEVFNYTFKEKSEYPKIAKDIIKNKGLSFDKAEKILGSVLNEDKIRKSKVDYGLVTFNVKNRVPKMLTKNDVPKGKLVEYILASATCFPMVEMKKIDGEYYIDGGYYDNLPINLAIDMGADEIIAVDLSAIGIKQKVKDEDIKINYIKNNYAKDFILDFNPKNARKNIRIGYNDTMKYYGKLDGKAYTFRKGDLKRNYANLSDYYIKLLKKILLSDVSKIKLTNVLKNKRYQNIFLNIKQGKSLEKEVNESIEYLASLFNIETEYVYGIERFNRKLIREAKSLNYITLDKNLKGKMLIGYIYNTYMNSENKEAVYKKLFNIALIFQKDFLAALYLISISNRYPITLKSDIFFDEVLKAIKK